MLRVAPQLTECLGFSSGNCSIVSTIKLTSSSRLLCNPSILSIGLIITYFLINYLSPLRHLEYASADLTDLSSETENVAYKLSLPF